MIYSQGHGGNPFDFEYFLEINEKFFQNGYDILSLSMTALGYNQVDNLKVTWPTKDLPADSQKDRKIYSYGSKIENFRDHNYFADYFDPNFPNKKPLSLMLSGNYYLIQNIIKNKNYDNIVMMGISGGAWNTIVMSSIIPEIKESISFSSASTYQAHNVPIALSWYRHWEEIDSELYNYADYDDFYNLATLDENFKPTRYHFQIFESDSITVDLLKKLNDKNPVKNFQIVELIQKDPSKEHSINTEYLFKKFGF